MFFVKVQSRHNIISILATGTYSLSVKFIAFSLHHYIISVTLKYVSIPMKYRLLTPVASQESAVLSTITWKHKRTWYVDAFKGNISQIQSHEYIICYWRHPELILQQPTLMGLSRTYFP